MTDIFISYSSKDRAVAERVRDALQDAGYDVFWDQSTPAGQDWDSWIRERLTGAKLVVTLWTKASVASPNVRHEAIIAREAGKLLPVMVDDLAPTDFPMGLFMVQALMIGRSERQFEAASAKFLDEVRARIGAAGGAAPRPRRPRRRRRLAIGLGLAALAAAIALFFAWPILTDTLFPDSPPVSHEHLKQSVDAEGLARQRVARAADNNLSGDPAMMGSTWAWGAGQLIAAAPDESRELADRYFDYLRSVENRECGCYYSDSIPHSIANAWVILAAARLRRPIPPRLLETVLAGQHPEGWWMISLNAVRSNENAAIHPTALLTIALAEARRAGIVPAPLRGRVDLAIRRAIVWLNRGPQEGNAWSDYPNNDRRTENLVFAAYAAVASRVAGEETSHAADAFIRSARALPPAVEQFSSGAYIPLTTGGRFFDDYRHPVSPWIGAAAVMAYRQAKGSQRRMLRDLIRQWLDVNLGDENLLRQDWLTGETLFLRAVAFRTLAADFPG
ncbi:MAG: hypothetical protein QOH47_3289 [Sphingomonadales bacterium]|nr:hypothetical protein [Sphingomonadales bacterium]